MSTEATFTIEVDRTNPGICVPANGHLFTPNLPGSGKRIAMILDDEDYEKVKEGAYPFDVTDQVTGIWHRVDRADCGAGCRCAAELVG